MSRSRYAKTKWELAKEIGISRPALGRLWKLPNHPQSRPNGGHPIDQWKQFSLDNIASYNRREPAGSNGKNGTHHISPRDAAFIARQTVSSQRESFKLEKEKREYWPRKEVNQVIDTANGVVARELRKAFEQELPPRLEGMAAGEIRKTLARKLDTILKSLPGFLPNSDGQV